MHGIGNTYEDVRVLGIVLPALSLLTLPRSHIKGSWVQFQ